MSAMTTHILDTSSGRPAAGVRVDLEFNSGADWRSLGSGTTDDDGRIKDLLSSDHRLDAGEYRLTFHVDKYFAKQEVAGFYKSIPIVFALSEPGEHYHVPLLLNPFGYSTYRGS